MQQYQGITAIDYETRDARGASFEIFRADFRVFSLSCAWYDETGSIRTWFSTSPYSIRYKLEELARNKTKITAHNLPYELSVTAQCYPDIELNWFSDTMRLCQVRDAGGDEFAIPDLSLEQTLALELGETSEKQIKKSFAKTRGLSLEACSARFLPEDRHNHKSEAHDYLHEQFKIKTNFGRHLDKLPYSILERYNNGDVINTLLLHVDCLEYFKTITYNWQPDHYLYFDRARLITGAYRQGININREKLYTYILELEKSIEDIEQAFFSGFANQINQAKELKKQRFMAKYLSIDGCKTIKGRWKRLLKAQTDELDTEWNKFNIGSALDLKTLFAEVLNMNAKFLTKKGSPSFKSTHLLQWGEGGDILLNRKKKLLVLQQCANAWLASEYDGKAHPGVRVAGTRTNRVSGGVNK